MSTTAKRAPRRPGNPPAPRESSDRLERSLRIVQPAGLESLARRKRSKRAPNALLRCECHHAKSIHARMYGNRKLGTPCNFPGCRCKAYRVA